MELKEKRRQKREKEEEEEEKVERSETNEYALPLLQRVSLSLSLSLSFYLPCLACMHASSQTMAGDDDAKVECRNIAVFYFACLFFI